MRAWIVDVIERTMFPQRVHYQRTDSPGWHIRDWDGANKLLTYFDPERWPFATFTLPDNSYVQCLGSKRRLTVEAREYRSDGSFTHWVFGRGRPLSEHVQIEVSTGSVTIDVSQQLTMRDARVIIRQFLETRTFPEIYHAKMSQRDLYHEKTGKQVLQRTRPSRSSSNPRFPQAASQF